MIVSDQTQHALIEWARVFLDPQLIAKPLILIGPQASGKTTIARAITSILTPAPSKTPLLSTFDTRVVLTLAMSRHPLIFDNMMRVSELMQGRILDAAAEVLKIEDAAGPREVGIPRVPIVVTSLTDQFSVDFKNHCAVIKLDPIPAELRADPVHVGLMLTKDVAEMVKRRAEAVSRMDLELVQPGTAIIHKPSGIKFRVFSNNGLRLVAVNVAEINIENSDQWEEVRG